MNTTTPRPVTLTPGRKDRFISGWAVTGLVLPLPTVALCWAVVLSGERGSRCLMYGEQCSTIPGPALDVAFCLSLVSGIAALVRPRGRRTYSRACTVFVQWGAQSTLGAMILSGV
ncbi:hypothetical protein Shyhy01_67220 [Streptomyces hygroscopicus subsp. hygroscopicus]|nr:hypothetical protein [Streptomyces hygroscopicus]GLX53773.1 hypothetical protein Shyhy01_67220 [Streptomyces hygroscopicus subsp. hygroscopicus]